MLRFRPKLGSERSSEWRCCFCLHVRTGTILLGTWHLMLHLMALGFLAAVVRDPRLMEELERESAPMSDLGSDGVTLSGMELPDQTPATPYTQHISQPRDHGLIYLCTLAITLMLIYGAVRGKPAHLLPFFCLQIFDFAITVLTATGYLYYLRSIQRLVSKRVPWREELLQLPAPVLALVVLTAFLVAVLLKGYCISIVWRCYKYLTLRAHAMQSLTPFVISTDSVVGMNGAPVGAPGYMAAPAPDYSSLLPDYEEAVKQTPPPSYRAATLMAGADVERAEAEPPSPAFTVPTPAATTPPTTTTTTPTSTTTPAPTSTVVMLPHEGRDRDAPV
ncbi:hypothetical protein NE865_16385 [Phthorimaea operculella]|nr:hypothetical protein NE865_16385 [Phthorimaea operculella]